MGDPCESRDCSPAVGVKDVADWETWNVPLDFLEDSQMGNGSNVSFLQFFKSTNLERADGVQGDSSDVVRIVISLVYSVVCALGLVGNLLVLYLMKIKQGWRKSPINLFVTSLAVTDFQFVLTLPFWAVENALDFNWLFGKAMCKIVSYVTAMNMYASVFFLTAMSIARYHSVSTALKNHQRGDPLGGCCSAKWLCVLIWLLAILASLPHAIFSTTATVFDDVLCLVKFPEGRGSSAQFWLGMYHIQKVLLGFVVPLIIISLCYLLLVRFINEKHVGSKCSGPGSKRRAKVTRSVSIVVLAFFLCWLPNQALTTWGILIKLNVVNFSTEYFLSQVYFFPISVCLAHSNSCLNPILYCLMRREFRSSLKSLLWRITSPSLTTMRPFTNTTKPEQEEQVLHALVPDQPVQPVAASCPHATIQPEAEETSTRDLDASLTAKIVIWKVSGEQQK
ncbi:relaxin-3 receptor 1 isoform X1 [Neopsephotus bourkii]|uniref:relaxin-3 receptor 1 isoform X1 n=1 Tax=Neopsephotus bourkii TaxID=309878 RepID=UPI002AA53218|nr:relaxin-3 receptor 1 isoform X1 [Neopsephotus bourkii]